MQESDLFKTLPEGFRLGTEEDIALVTLTIAQAFADYEYPIPTVKLPYKTLLRFYYVLTETIVRNTLQYGYVLTNDDFSAVMLVVPLEHMADYNVPLLIETLKEAGCDYAVENLEKILSYIGQEEHNFTVDSRAVYVEEFAVQPPRQGQKLGSKLMRELFAQCEKEQRDVLLYTNTDKNVSIYHHFGFETVHEAHREELNSDTYFLVHYAEANA